MSPAPADDRRDGPRYRVSAEEKERFARDGYVHLCGVLSDDELGAIEAVYDRFLKREIVVPGKDLCDMSGDYTKTFEQYSIVNVMLPRRYHPAWQGNLYEQRAASIAAQLHGPGMVIDYDQLLAKRPFKTDAVFEWHQDQAYWPVLPDSRTATCWLAIDDSTLANGCMRFVPGTHRGPLRPHRPLKNDRGESHTLLTDVDPARDEIRPVPIRRGDITVHNERVLHGSGGNSTSGWRRAYIVAFRAAPTVVEERRLGFTHSHNDEKTVLEQVGFADGDAQ
ncbi:MAG: phytanoyl-CoA dioxygenase family protein [Planctomycetes bacterium]|nr:phytanoyl-CoA dioxygenase family protein [Planctomycetota bacterium]